MPAPATIRTQYTSPVLLSNLSAEAGAASQRRDSAQRAYQMQLQQMAQDSAFLRDEANRRYSAATMVPQQSPTFLQDSAGYNRPQHFTNPNADLMGLQRAVMAWQESANSTGFMPGGGGSMPSNPIQRYAMQRQASANSTGFMPSRSMQPEGNAAAPLVPSSGPIKARTPSVIQERGGPTFTRFPEGTQIISAAGEDPAMAQQLREMGPRFGAQPNPMVTPQVRAQLDVVRSLPGLTDAQRNSLEQAAMSGQLKLDQLIDDAHAMLPSSTAQARLTADDRLLEKTHANLRTIAALDAATPSARADWAAANKLFEPEEATFFNASNPADRRALEMRNVRAGDRAFQNYAELQKQIAASDTGVPLPMTEGDQTPVGAGGGLQPGTVEDGYRFKGGDPADPKNWEVE